MPTIIFDKLATKLDGTIKAAVMGFLEKLSEDDTLPGLHIEPIVKAIDPRVRTGRVNQGLRAVLFKLAGDQDSHYLFHGVWPHDEAIAKAMTLTLSVNPINGQAMIRQAAESNPARAVATMTSLPVPPAGPAWLEQRGYFTDGLVKQLGLPQDVAARAMAVTSDDALMTLAQQEEGWIADVLLDLAAETSLSVIIGKLDLNELDSASEPSDEALLRALQTPAAKAQFAFIDEQEELRRVIEGGNFGQWRVFLHPEQRRYATAAYSGAFRLTGAAGTGKTVILVHRAKTLAARAPKSRIVLTTYTRNLSEALRESLAELDNTIPLVQFDQPGVAVFGVDALVYAVLKHAGTGISDAVGLVLGHPRAEVQRRTPARTWSDVIDIGVATLPPQIANNAFFEAEYSTVVLPNRIATREEYLRVRRQGRGIALNREKRNAVWDIIAAYRSETRALETVDFAEAAAIATAWLEARPADARPFADHVLVDEGQDLSPPQWQFLRALVPEGSDDLFIAEDVHQRIYGHRIAIGRYGIRTVGRSRRLTLNYRTTAQNLRAALDTLIGADYRDIEDESQPVDLAGYRSARTGPDPIRIPVSNRDQEAADTARYIQAWFDADPDIAPDTIAVLVHDQRSRDRMVDDLASHGIAARSIDRERPLPGKVLVMTMHRAKGLEFSKVIIAAHGAWPGYFKGLIKDWDTSLREEADLRERSLIYVAMTRARDELVIITR
ncbi:MAG: UvrD-helicase domain-containing protein [Propionibacteriaceae bacterium]|jgi:superfamily I DNA/RNA helicase|nr:UvrD-helicase domain-containing protein [Propionibacteriaceae bacterium]